MKKKNKETIEILLEKEDHSGADFSNEKLTGLDLRDKKFISSDLSNVNFAFCNVLWCDFSNAKLDGVSFLGANLYGCKWNGAKRNGRQIEKAASVVSGENSIYGFKCTDGVVLVNEGNKKESEFKQANATNLAILINNLLLNG